MLAGTLRTVLVSQGAVLGECNGVEAQARRRAIARRGG
jgi:hypothetical protein